MLQTCGISSIVSLNMNDRKVELPKNASTNEYKQYHCQEIMEIIDCS